jgi:glutamate dehydrogenase (NAD(P)+)
MSEEILLQETDEIGPETMAYVYNAETGMKGLLVVDSMPTGTAGGGIRMLPDITADEIFGLARAMTNKFAILGLPRGGCKGGIWGDPMMPKEKKEGIMKAFGRALKPYLESRMVSLATDMGISSKDLEAVYEGAGIAAPGKGLSSQEKNGEPLENHLTGFGVVVAMRTACEVAGMNMSTARVAIEGFGKVGGGALRYSAREGAKVVAISTIHEAIHNKDGLDTQQLFELRKRLGDKCLKEYKDAEHLPASNIYFLPVDILMPGARPFVLTQDNIHQVQAKILSSGSNIPITHEAEKIFFQKGLSVPDFIANSGGTISAMVSYLGGNADQAFEAIEKLISRLTTEVLTEACEQHIDPYTVALDKCKRRVWEARAQDKKLTFQETMQEIKGRLGVF